MGSETYVGVSLDILGWVVMMCGVNYGNPESKTNEKEHNI